MKFWVGYYLCSVSICNKLVFTGVGYQPPAPPPNWRTREVTLRLASTLRSVQHGWPYQEYKTPANIALGVTETHKPSHCDKVLTSWDGMCPNTVVHTCLSHLKSVRKLHLGRRDEKSRLGQHWTCQQGFPVEILKPCRLKWINIVAKLPRYFSVSSNTMSSCTCSLQIFLIGWHVCIKINDTILHFTFRSRFHVETIVSVTSLSLSL